MDKGFLDDRDIPDKTCKHCRWWDKNDGRGDYEHDCRLEFTNENLPNHNHCFAESWDSSEGVIVTGPDFGCIHWEKKE